LQIHPQLYFETSQSQQIVFSVDILIYELNVGEEGHDEMNDQCKTYDGRYAELNTEEAIKWMNLCFN
jgi:hypothetical protein